MSISGWKTQRFSPDTDDIILAFLIRKDDILVVIRFCFEMICNHM